MAQYCYYTTNDSSSASQVKRIGYAGSTYRKVGYKNTVFILESWQSCSANYPYSYTVLTEGVSGTNKVKHTFTAYYYTATTNGQGGSKTYTDITSFWDSHFSSWDASNNSQTCVELTYFFQNWVSLGNLYYSAARNAMSTTYSLRVMSGNTANIQTNSSHTYSQTMNVGQDTRLIELQWQSSQKPNGGTLAPLSNYYNGFTDSIQNKTTTRFTYNESPYIFVWNTW